MQAKFEKKFISAGMFGFFAGFFAGNEVVLAKADAAGNLLQKYEICGTINT
ncbi:MAG: hypothetical protein LBG83_09285 [Oscillospiraceae bacterium]|nr:hypothetical protein [Oscillospiraceae bacterium]